MPKMTRKLLEKKKDFQKVKLKVGKKKQAKENETRTTFKSQAIVVPEQSISEDKGEATTGRNQTLKELLAHCKHYNPNIRKEGLTGIRELFLRHPHSVMIHLSVVFESTFGAMVDDDVGVRQAFLALLTAMTPRLTKNNVAPFTSLFLSYCGSGMTHIYDDIRLTSLDYLNLWLEAFPTLLVTSPVRILQHFLSLLSNFDQKSISSQSPKLLTNPTGKLGSSKSRISVLSSLFRYLNISIYMDKEESWFDLFRSDRAADGLAKPTFSWTPHSQFYVNLQERIPFAEAKPLDLSAPMDLDSMEKEKGVDLTKTSHQFLSHLNIQNLKQCQHFIKMMMAILLECWVESAPGISTEFVSAGGPTMRSSALLVLELMVLLWEHHQLLLKKTTSPKKEDINFLQTFAKDIKKHFVIHFPFGQTVAARMDAKAVEILRQMNVIFCRVVSLLFLQPMGSESDLIAPQAKTWQRLVYDYLSKQLVFNRNAAPLTPDVFENMLPTLWRYFNHLPSGLHDELLQVLVTFGDGAGPQSNLKRLYLDFMSKYFFFADQHRAWKGQTTEIIKKWASSLTKLLWELGNKNAETTRLIFQVIASLAKRKQGDSKSLFSTIQLSLIPFFAVVIPAKDGGKANKVFGPFVSLPADVQRMSIDVLYYFDQLPSKLLIGLSFCLNSATVGDTVVRHALQIISLKQELFASSPEVYISFLLSVLLGYSQDELQGLRDHHHQNQKCQSRFITTKTILDHLHEEDAKARKMTDSHLWNRRQSITEGLCQSLRALAILSAGEFVDIISEQLVGNMFSGAAMVPIDFCVGFIGALGRLGLRKLPEELEEVLIPLALALLVESLHLERSHEKHHFDEFGLVVGTLGQFFGSYKSLAPRFLSAILSDLEAAKTPDDVHRRLLILIGLISEEKLALCFAEEGLKKLMGSILTHLLQLVSSGMMAGFEGDAQQLITDMRIKFRISV